MHDQGTHHIAGRSRRPMAAGAEVELPGRGTTFVWDIAGPAGAPTVVLLHGWTATAELSWSASVGALAAHFRVIALDHRGHGRGIRTDGSFSLAECADDVAALVGVLGLGSVVVVGYSMGGPIAQLVWQRHPELVAGVVLCSTADVFDATSRDHRRFGLLDRLAVAARVPGLRGGVERTLRALAAAKARTRAPGSWALEQIARHDWFAVLEAGRAIGRHDARAWLGQLSGPSAVVVTPGDEVVPADRQLAMARRLADATVHEVDGGHAACFDPVRFAGAVAEACRSVAGRGRRCHAMAA